MNDRVDTTNEIFKHFSDDPDEIKAILKNEEDPPLLYVVNEDLSRGQMFNLSVNSYLLPIWYGEQQRYGIPPGLYKEPRIRFDKIDPQWTAKCSSAKKWVNKMNVQPILRLLEDPLSVLINPKLDKELMKSLKNPFEIVEVDCPDGNEAILCAYYDNSYKPKESVVFQSDTFTIERVREINAK